MSPSEFTCIVGAFNRLFRRYGRIIQLIFLSCIGFLFRLLSVNAGTNAKPVFERVIKGALFLIAQ